MSEQYPPTAMNALPDDDYHIRLRKQKIAEGYQADRTVGMISALQALDIARHEDSDAVAMMMVSWYDAGLDEPDGRLVENTLCVKRVKLPKNHSNDYFVSIHRTGLVYDPDAPQQSLSRPVSYERQTISDTRYELSVKENGDVISQVMAWDCFTKESEARPMGLIDYTEVQEVLQVGIGVQEGILKEHQSMA